MLGHFNDIRNLAKINQNNLDPIPGKETRKRNFYTNNRFAKSAMIFFLNR